MASWPGGHLITTKAPARFGPIPGSGVGARVWNNFSLTAFLDFTEEQCPMSGIGLTRCVLFGKQAAW
jgi:hypothetical protein